MPNGFHGGKARWCALEVRLEGESALCLHGSGEGKRGRMACRGLRRGSARFAYRIQRRESAVGCLGGTSGGARRALPQRELMKKESSMYKKSDHPLGTGSALGGRDWILL